MTRKKIITIGVFVAISLGGGLYIGATNLPGSWYQALAKPSLTPPSWLFGPVWSLLYVLIGLAGAEVFRSDHVRKLMPIWGLQMLLNFVWSPVVFSAHSLTLGLFVIIALLATIVFFIISASRRVPIAAALFAPYLLWVGFATYLNAALLVLN
ncbi:TspO and MBR related proteins [Cohaesibacter sp. ES.047]|uniref:TspO/MBR family protein n=1 Tax=Cohaesibacter sp. ES.047 TaxID=1798205 RepID=UPI000BB78257|nr:TspO/MBR family protein [Cohaesibacter sp. ES.047]SNY91311.1 TspO and MBR related proteins [Cohaesibacter sp. ES.047]